MLRDVHSSDSFTFRNRVYHSPCPIHIMVDDWRRQHPQAGVTFCYRKLVGDCTPEAHLIRSSITNSKFKLQVMLLYMSLPIKILRCFPPPLLLWLRCGV